jgi:DNA-binding CsgD family transcriptional regulator
MGNPVDHALFNPVRLGELIRLRLLDAPAEEAFDRLTRLAVRMLGVPIALVSLVDDHRQFFISATGLPEPLATVRETPLTHSLCKHVVASATTLTVSDARIHPLLQQNAAVRDLGIVAYLGVPLTTLAGNTLGSFCAVEMRPRHWTTAEQLTMTDLAACVMTEFTLRFARREMQAIHAGLRRETLVRQRSLQTLLRTDGQPHVTERLARAVTMIDRAGLVTAPIDTAQPGVPDAVRMDGFVLEAHRARLTARQQEVFDQLVRGLQTKDIARALHLSPRTIEVHRANILHTLHLESFTQLLKQLLAAPDAP